MLGVLVPALVALLTFAVFLPSLQSGFVDWDDHRMFVENLQYRGLGPAQIQWVWTTVRLGEYMPLTWTSYGADYAFWGMEPFGYHLTNVLLHTEAALLVYALALRLLSLGASAGPGGAAGSLGAGLAALAFSLHPLRAEPVAWVSARGTVLGGLLLLLATLAYVTGWARSDGSRIPRSWLLGAAGLFTLSLLARSTGVVLPAILVVLDAYPLRRLGGGPGRWLGPEVRHVWREKLPFVGLALAAVPLALLARASSGDAFRRDHYDPLVGAAVAVRGAVFYLQKTMWPGGLSPLYEMPSRLNPWAWPFLLSGTVVVLVTVLLVVLRSRWPAGLAAWVSYGVILAPMSGLIPLGLLHLAADRYSYVSCVSWALLAGAGLAAGWRAWRRGRIGAPVAALGSVLVLVVLAGWGARTWTQVQVWRDSRTLWTHTVSVAPDSAVAQNNLGAVLESAGDYAAAVEPYRRAADIWPAYAPFFTNVGRALARGGRLVEAEEALRRAIALRPGAAEGYVSLGVVLYRQGRVPEAIEQYRKALGLTPGLVEARANLEVAVKQLEAGAGPGQPKTGD